ncbi:MAG: phosphomannomutase/phosphoglucomutase, partial [Bacilli bacterium]
IKELIAFDYQDKIDLNKIALNYQTYNLLEHYSAYLIKFIQEQTKQLKPLSKLNIIVDAGNGVTGFFENILKTLGANTRGSQFLNPDGYFSNHPPNPEDIKAINSLKEACIKYDVDLGIIFDADGDRSGFVLENKELVNKNSYIALMSAIILEQYPNTYIVTDSITSDGLTKFIIEHKGFHHRFKRGYKNVIDEALRFNLEGKKTHLAIETSGHGALLDNYFLDDGAYMACLVLIKLSQLKQENKKLSSLIETLEKAKYSKEERFNVSQVNNLLTKERWLALINEYFISNNYSFELPNYEGFKIRLEKGFILVRTSLHENLLVVNYEGEDLNQYHKILNMIKEIGEQYNG